MFTTEGDNVAAVCMHKFPRYGFLHYLLHLKKRKTQFLLH